MSIFKTIKKVVYFTTYSVMVAPAIGMIGYAAMNWEELNQPPEPVTVTEKTRAERFAEVFASLPAKTGMPAEWVDCLLIRESGKRIMVKRYEPGQERIAKRITTDPELVREYASSHGPFQIMGWHTKLDLDGSKHDRGDFVDLYDAEFAGEQFARIMGECRTENSRTATYYDHVKEASACYNGTGDGARKYGQAVADCVARKAVERLKG